MKLFAEYFKTTYRHLANTFFSLLALLAFIPANSSALEKDDAAVLLKGLQQAQIQSYFTINAFYNFSANDGDKALLMDVNEAINNVNSTLNTLEAFNGLDEVKSEIEAANQSWQTHKTTLNTITNDILDQGYADLRLMSDLAIQNQEFENILANTYKKVKDDGSYTLNKVTEKSREAALLMASMMTKYSARTTSNVSQIFQGGDDEKTIDILAADLDKLLKDLLAASNADQKKSIDSVLTKWDFIRNSYINYNEKNVNYVVNLYSKRIIDALGSTSDLD
jgi:hypothetical protein